MRLAVWVESLLGYGHALRALNLVKAFPDCDRIILSGSIAGRPLLESQLGKCEHVYLEEMHMDKPDGDPLPKCGTKEAAFTRRTETAWKAISRFEPDVMIFEHFPFGRWSFREEILELIARLRKEFPKCSIVSSVRDIPQGDARRRDYQQIVRMILESAFDLVVVHGAKDIISLTSLMPNLPAGVIPIEYTGYLGDGHVYDWISDGPLLIDLGGGWASTGLLQPLLKMKAPILAQFSHVVVLAGALAEVDIQDLKKLAGPDLQIELLCDAPTSHQSIQSASVCVTRMGYNAGVRALCSRVPVIAVPHTFSSEQILRARCFALLGRLSVCHEETLKHTPMVVKDYLNDAIQLASNWRPMVINNKRLREVVLHHCWQ